MSACGTAWSRMKSAIPGRTNTPRPTSPITGSQQYSARRFSPRTRPTACRIASPIPASPMYPDSTASQSANTPRAAMPSTSAPTVSPLNTCPVQSP